MGEIMFMNDKSSDSIFSLALTIYWVGGHSVGGKGSRAGDEWSKLVPAGNALHKNIH